MSRIGRLTPCGTAWPSARPGQAFVYWLGSAAMFFLSAPGRSVGLLAAALAMVSTSGAWLTFPLSPPLSGAALPLIDGVPGLTFGRVVQALVLVAALVALIAPGLAVPLLGIALAITIWLVVDVALLSPPALSAYVTEAWQQDLLQSFARREFTPNNSPEPAFIAIDSFAYLLDQLALARAMLGWGWASTVAAIVCLAGAAWAQDLRAWLLFGLVAAGAPAIAAAPPVARALDAERLQLRGDRLAASVDTAAAAVAAYSAALRANPALAGATPFLVRAADSIRSATGGRHPAGEIGDAWRMVDGSRPQGRDAAALRAVRLRLADMERSDPGSTGLDTPLAGALRVVASELRVRLLLAEGFAHDTKGNRLAAAAQFERALQSPWGGVAAMFLAQVQLEGSIATTALDPLNRLKAQIDHPAVRADVSCTIGDVLTRAGDLQGARAAYLSCREEVSGSLRAIRALSGS